MAMLVIVVIVGGVAAAFFLLSQVESQRAEGTRNRAKAYYLGEAALEQVASMVKVATTSFKLPPNPADPSSPPSSPITGTLLVNNMPSKWVFQHYDFPTQRWVPFWDFVANAWSPSAPSQGDVALAGGDPTKLHLYIEGQLTILVEPSSVVPGVNAKNSETFNYTAINFENLTGVGTGNTGIKNYYNVAVQGRVLHYDSVGKMLSTRGSNVALSRELEISNNSILPFFAFFNNDLEFLPGPAFVGNGKIHTNGDLYLGGGTSIDLNTDYIGAVGQMYRHRKNDGSYTENAGPVTLHQPIPGTPTPGAKGAGSATWAETTESATVSGTTVTSNSNWASQLASAGLSPTVQQGAQTMATPPIGSIQPPPAAGATGGTFYEWAKNTSPQNGVNAGLLISVDTSGNVSALYNGGSGQVDVTSALKTQGVISSSTIADNRQSQTTSLSTTVIDMGKLKTSGFFPSSGVLYTTDARNGTPTVSTDAAGNTVLSPPSPPPTLPSGFVFMDGKTLPGPVNIVSNGPVYVQGDFNIPVTDPVTGAISPKQPAAVIADAVNLLSNAWTNSKTPGSSPPTASDTSYNFALVTGNVPTVPGVQYSGGLENLPRFHENWGNINCNYRGSLINLWTSAIAQGVWGQGNVYSPPNRNWDWDSGFGTSGAQSQIPGFPRAVSISRTIFSMDYWGAGGSSSYRSAQ